MRPLSILQGWNNYLTNKLTTLEKQRALHCAECPEAVVGTFEKFMRDESLKEIQGLKCNICKCPLSTKLRSKKEKCPLKKW